MIALQLKALQDAECRTVDHPLRSVLSGEPVGEVNFATTLRFSQLRDELRKKTSESAPSYLLARELSSSEINEG